MVVAALAATTVALPVQGVAAATKKKPTLKVGVFDNYYSPIPKKALKKGTTVRWTWDPSTIDVHDVALKSGPKGVKKFHSDPLAGGLSYSKSLTKPGTYKFICTFHTEMKMTLRVAKS